MNYALVIGINDYEHTDVYPKLRSAVKDADDIARKLTELNFDVDCSLDDDKDTVQMYWCNFLEKIAKEKCEVAVVYFAGHGVMANQYDCLLMREAIAVSPYTGILPDSHSLKVQHLIDDMRANGDQMNIIIIDACRTMANMRGTVARNFGTTTKVPFQTFIAYSTSPGKGAKDGTEKTNSPFAAALLNHIGDKNLPVEMLFKTVRKEIQENGIDQLPWENSCLVDNFCFNHGQIERHYDSIYAKSCFTSAAGDRDACLVKSLMMNGKENLLGKLATLKKALTPPAIFGIGRAIAGLVKQKEIEAVEVLKYNKIGLFTENGKNHLLNGILYGVYFDIEDRLCKPDGREMDILDELDRLFEQKEFDSSVNFIRHEMESFKDEIDYIPGDRNTYKVYLEIESATEETTEDNHQVWVIKDMSIKDETDSLPETGKVCFNIKELRNAIRDQFWIPLAKIKCIYSEKVENDDLFVLDKLDIADILNDYFVGNCISDMDDICHHYEYVGIDDFYIQHLMPEEEYLRVQGTFTIQVVVYLDSEEEIMDDKCIDGEYDMVLDYDNDKWSVVDIDKMKLDLPQI